MRLAFVLPIALAAAGCGGGDSNQDALQDAANQSTPEAAQVLNGAAENGMDPQAALNAAAEAQAGNASTTAPPRMQARPNLPNQPNPAQPGQPPEKVPTTTNSQ
jgi:hypothetical protein